MARNPQNTISSTGFDRLQHARRLVEQVKKELYLGGKISRWTANERAIFCGLAIAEQLLCNVVLFSDAGKGDVRPAFRRQYEQGIRLLDSPQAGPKTTVPTGAADAQPPATSPPQPVITGIGAVEGMAEFRITLTDPKYHAEEVRDLLLEGDMHFWHGDHTLYDNCVPIGRIQWVGENPDFVVHKGEVQIAAIDRDQNSRAC